MSPYKNVIDIMNKINPLKTKHAQIYENDKKFEYSTMFLRDYENKDN